MKKKNLLHLSIVASLFLGNLLCAEEVYLLEGIKITTANKMEENIKDISQSITIMNDVEIEERGIDKVSDLVEYIPNLSSTETVNFRGLNASMFTNASPMTIYVDGIPYSHRWGFNKTISNVLRVEALRGPQGSIYGKDSMGGVINIVTKDPSNTLEGSIKAEYGTDNFQEATFDISTPLIDNKLFFSINGFYSQNDGWVTNHYPGSKGDHANEEERYLGNVKLIYKPTDDLSVKLNASKDSDKRYGKDGGRPSSTDVHSYKRDDFKDVYYDQNQQGGNESDAQALSIDYDFSSMTFSSLTTHLDTEVFSYNDMDFSAGNSMDGYNFFMEMESESIAQEFRLSNNSDGLRWLIGLYYENQKDDILVATRAVKYTDRASEIENETIAAFGQVVIPFLDDSLELTLGGRLQRIKRDIDAKFFALPAGTTGDPQTVNPSYNLDEDDTWDDFLPKIALSYKINNDLSSYFSIARGVLAGGFNYAASAGTAEQNSFDAQKSTNYELGIRGNLLDNSLYLSAALFYMDIEDIHVYSNDSVTNITYTSNAGKAHSQGIELELGYNINDHWKIDTSLGLIQAKYDDYINMAGINLSDNKIQGTPSHTANISLAYLNDNGIYGRFTLRNQGKVYFDESNTFYEDSYTTADIRAGYLLDNWDLYIYSNNISDESYLTSASATSVTFGEGRFIGIGAKYNY